MPQKQKSERERVVSPAAAAPRRKAAATTRTPARKKHSIPQAEMPAPSSVELPAAPLAPTFEEISQLAYSYWEARGYQGGSPEEDWLRAEQELLVRITA